MGQLEGKVAIVTGAARGIGAATARLFVREGARVMLADMLEEPLAEVARELGDGAVHRTTNVADEDEVRALVAAAVDRFGGLDVAILNAGIVGPQSSIEEYPAEVFDQVMAVNVRGVWLGLKHAMRAMRDRGGSIVVTSSTAGIRATGGRVAYVASKHATIGLMRAAALEGAGRGIRVNSVNPATIDTPMVQALEASSAEANTANRSHESAIPLGRRGTAEEVAELMLFLASEASSFCTGGVYMVDGGVSAGIPVARATEAG